MNDLPKFLASHKLRKLRWIQYRWNQIDAELAAIAEGEPLSSDIDPVRRKDELQAELAELSHRLHQDFFGHGDALPSAA